MSEKSPKIEKKGTRRISIAVSDELYKWIEDLASEMGLAPATCGTVLLNEAKKNRENQVKMIELFNNMSKTDFVGMQNEFKAVADDYQEQLKLPSKD